MRISLTSTVVLATLALGATPALAQEKRSEVTDMTAAISRDLGLSIDQVKRLGPQQERAIALVQQLQKQLGDGFAGSHFDIKSGQLIVNVTDKGLLEQVKGAGATPQLVSHSLKELGEIKATLSGDPHAGEQREIVKGQGAFAGLALDPVSNSVQITATKEQAGAAREAAAKYGDA